MLDLFSPSVVNRYPHPVCNRNVRTKLHKVQHLIIFLKLSKTINKYVVRYIKKSQNNQTSLYRRVWNCPLINTET